MIRLLTACVFASALGCTDHKCGARCESTGTPDGPPVSPADSVASCTTGQADKIKFTQENGCANDGGVEFCIPDSDPAVLTTLTAISAEIVCAPGGGRAGCQASPGLLLCSYPTLVPTACVTVHGAMTADAWADMCAISGLPTVTQIVPTIFE